MWLKKLAYHALSILFLAGLILTATGMSFVWLTIYLKSELDLPP